MDDRERAVRFMESVPCEMSALQEEYRVKTLVAEFVAIRAPLEARIATMHERIKQLEDALRECEPYLPSMSGVQRMVRAVLAEPR